MAMETLGGNLPAGRPAAAFAGGKTHVFAIGAGGMLYHWSSANGIDWQGPEPLVRVANTNVVPAFPCAIALGNAVHVFAINNGGSLLRWFSLDGNVFLPPFEESAWTIGDNNGVAVCSWPGSARVDVFAVSTNQGLIRYSWNNMATSVGASLGSAPLPPSPVPGNLPRCVPAAVNSGPTTTDVFAVGPDGSALRWRSIDTVTWSVSVLPRPAGAPPGGQLVRSGFTAVSPAPGEIELFAVMPSGLLAHWSINGANVTAADILPSPSLNDSVPTAIIVSDHIEVFAIGPRPNDFAGGVLVRWRRDRGVWSAAHRIGANLSSGGLDAVATNTGRVHAFGLGGSGLQHWPAGVAAAATDRWANWANSVQFDPAGHCRPSTEEEVAAIITTAERTTGARVRAVGSSWSFTDIAVPSAPGFLVETNEISGLITHVIDAAVLTENAPTARYLRHVAAGTKVEDLMGLLDSDGLAPFTMGGSSGQTLAGVISTSVHGAHWDRGPIPNAVRAIQLVGPGGQRYWVEPDQWRITREDVLRQRLGPDVQIRYDDDWFDAVLVSMGSMGVITSVVLEVTDQYFLRKTCVEMTWSQLRPQLADGSRFADPDHYVMVAFDPVGTAAGTCYVTTCQRDPGPASPGGGSFDPLAAYCQLDLAQVLTYVAGSGLLNTVAEALLSVITATAGAFGIPLPAGATLTIALPIIAGVLKAQGNGAVGDFLGNALEKVPAAAAAFATYMTRESLKPGQSFVDIGHRVMAPPNPGECAARGLALELAFDATSDAYLIFVDEALKVIDQRLTQGMVLGGWFSMRFVGPSRAILSPQQSARTCMIEIVGLRSLDSTAPLLDELEQLGKLYGAIQHWGMHNILNLAATDLPRAYPRLDTWRRVRREITNGGTLQTFENSFTARLGLDAAPAGAPLIWQQDWKWCNKCLGMAYAGGAPGPCPATGTHEHGFSGNYGFAHNAPWAPGQRHWRWCSKCMGMTLENQFAAPCPAGGAHDLSRSGEYTIVRNGEADWKWCDKCQGASFSVGAPAVCPAGGVHNYPVAGGGYWLTYEPGEKPASLLPPDIPAAPILRPGGRERFIRQPKPVWSSLEAPGQRGWMRCTQCSGLTFAGGVCIGGGPHKHNGSPIYIIPLNAPTAPGQAHWRYCRKCNSLAYRPGACFAGGMHDLTGSGDYVLRTAGQNQWRFCKNCNGLWFSGNGGQGRCASPAGVHDLGVDDYAMLPR